MRKSFELIADYHQVLLMAGPDVVAIDAFSDADCRRRLVQAPGIVVLMTERNMTVPVTLDVVATAPPLDLAAGDHVAEASLNLAAGRLCVQGLMDFACEEMPVAPGHCRVRLTGCGYATLSADGLEGEDRYDLTLWPAPMGEVEVLKQWER